MAEKPWTYRKSMALGQSSLEALGISLNISRVAIMK